MAGARLIAIPEIGLDRFFPQHPARPDARRLAKPIPGSRSQAVSELARQLSLVMALNLYEAGAGGRCFDSSPVLDADGTLLGVTRIVHITD